MTDDASTTDSFDRIFIGFWPWRSPDGAKRNPGSSDCRNRGARISRSLSSGRALRGPAGLIRVICPSGSFVSSPLCKNISVSTTPKSLLELFASHSTEGRIAIVTDAGRDAVDAAAFCARWDRRASRKTCERSTARGREMLSRTAKSCGPDAPTLASSLRMLSRPYRA